MLVNESARRKGTVKLLKNFVAACVVAGAMVWTPVPVQAQNDCLAICLYYNDWEICIIICT